LADAQAQETLRENPNDAMATAVAAYVSAARGQTRAAVEQIAAALKQTPGEPFVQRTAAQVVAWFDSNPTQLTDQVKPTVDWIKQHFSGLAEYANAYAAAMQSRPQTGETTQPSAATPTTSGPKMLEYRNGQAVEVPQSYNDMEPTYVPDYYGSYYPSYYGSPYYGGVGYYYYPAPVFFTDPFHCRFIHRGLFLRSQPFRSFESTAFRFDDRFGQRSGLITRPGFIDRGDRGGFRTFSSPAPRFDAVPMRAGRSQDFRGQTIAPTAPRPAPAPAPVPMRSAPSGSRGSSDSSRTGPGGSFRR